MRSEFALLGLPWPSVIVDGGAVLEGKPSPQGFLAASARLGCAAAECLVVEDAEAGVAAGLAAGMTVLAIDPPPGGPRLATAHARFPSLEAASGAIRDWVLASDPAAEVP
ncbi:MAG TPA: HAD-IA family hydrolase [Candidatus Nanopelagicaceae bacterium]|nr:HAD-IA family hydrolase [Candidatus Nanopelagicaceae bacterium]